ncbi:MAG: aspartate-semialdehyde dehydrogenase [Candidatus Thermoplasmatota archaeon]|nr:aspartate-semialdehyde dehydrogenase [Candidatus Thermoplasmatota archaeon]
MSRKRVAIIGASGLVGQRFCQLLSNHPFFEEPDLFAWERSDNRKLEEILRVPSNTISDSLLEKHITLMDAGRINSGKYDAIFSAIPSSKDNNIELELLKSGNRIFTNSSTNRMLDTVPIVVPEINSEHMEMFRDQKGYIIANGNCSTIGLAIPLKPLLPLEPEHIEVTTMQALSGAGYPGVPSLDAVSNMVPFIESEEEKIQRELPKVLGALNGNKITPRNIDMGVTCTRIPVREGHTESISVRFSRNIENEDISGLLSEFRAYPQANRLPSAPSQPIIVSGSEYRPQPELDLWNGTPERARGMAVTVGRIRKTGKYLRFVTLSHNTVRGAAGASVLNAEIAHSRGLL